MPGTLNKKTWRKRIFFLLQRPAPKRCFSPSLYLHAATCIHPSIQTEQTSYSLELNMLCHTFPICSSHSQVRPSFPLFLPSCAHSSSLFDCFIEEHIKHCTNLKCIQICVYLGTTTYTCPQIKTQPCQEVPFLSLSNQ